MPKLNEQSMTLFNRILQNIDQIELEGNENKKNVFNDNQLHDGFFYISDSQSNNMNKQSTVRNPYFKQPIVKSANKLEERIIIREKSIKNTKPTSVQSKRLSELIIDKTPVPSPKPKEKTVNQIKPQIKIEEIKIEDINFKCTKIPLKKRKTNAKSDKPSMMKKIKSKIFC